MTASSIRATATPRTKNTLPNPNAEYSEPIYSLRHVLRFVRAVRSPLFSHTRSPHVSPNGLYVYHVARNSPTGVLNAACIDRVYGEAVLKRLGLGGSQLSPTEGQFSSRR